MRDLEKKESAFIMTLTCLKGRDQVRLCRYATSRALKNAVVSLRKALENLNQMNSDVSSFAT